MPLRYYPTNWTRLGAQERREVRSARADVVVRARRVRTLADVLHSVNGELGVVHSSGVSCVLKSSMIEIEVDLG